MRTKIYKWIEPVESGTVGGKIYNIGMIACIVISVIPLLSATTGYFIPVIEYLLAAIFALDYILRWITADIRMNRKGWKAFVLYPLTPFALVDLISILSLLPPVYSTFRLVRLLRLVNSMRVFKFFRYSKSIQITINVFRRQKQYLLIVVLSTLSYIVLSAVIMLQIEPQTMKNLLNAIYWAAMTLTTVGYGDIVAVTAAGKIITMISTLVGVVVLALPAGIITAGYVEELDSIHRILTGMGPDETDYNEAAEFWNKNDKKSKKMPAPELLEEIDQFLKSHNTCALATGSRDFVRCTPIEYSYVDDKIYMFSEGGLKFVSLKHNKNVSLAIFEPFDGYGNLRGLQIQGKAEMINHGTKEFRKILISKNIHHASFDGSRKKMHLIRITLESCDYLSSENKKKGYSLRQHIDL